jgi:hypothetical protein
MTLEETRKQHHEAQCETDESTKGPGEEKLDELWLTRTVQFLQIQGLEVSYQRTGFALFGCLEREIKAINQGAFSNLPLP